MTSDLDELRDSLLRLGWTLELRCSARFCAELKCATDLLPAHLPRPIGRGKTWREAVQRAVEDFAATAPDRSTADRQVTELAAAALWEIIA